MNRNDLTAQIASTLGSYEADYDVEGIADEIMDAYGLVHVDAIDTDAYWAIVERHDQAQ
ncbi:hypothetical protein ACQEU5_25110 [Marinactinospora thermotolerans]|uniref:hypothetical protein n=1 Tax=Marinactinospora thermotolerans TaxID=531310 RepID=UPI003D8BAB8C